MNTNRELHLEWRWETTRLDLFFWWWMSSYFVFVFVIDVFSLIFQDSSVRSPLIQLVHDFNMIMATLSVRNLFFHYRSNKHVVTGDLQ